MTDLALIERMKEAAGKATPGEWTVWKEPTPHRSDAIAELIGQVNSTEPFVGAIWLLNANGKCPALTGCGPTSEANAAHIALCSPDNIRTLIRYAERVPVLVEALREMQLASGTAYEALSTEQQIGLVGDFLAAIHRHCAGALSLGHDGDFETAAALKGEQE